MSSERTAAKTVRNEIAPEAQMNDSVTSVSGISNGLQASVTSYGKAYQRRGNLIVEVEDQRGGMQKIGDDEIIEPSIHQEKNIRELPHLQKAFMKLQELAKKENISVQESSSFTELSSDGGH